VELDRAGCGLRAGGFGELDGHANGGDTPQSAYAAYSRLITLRLFPFSSIDLTSF